MGFLEMCACVFYSILFCNEMAHSLFHIGVLVKLRSPVDFAHLAGVSAHMFPSAPPTSDPGSSERVQLH